MKNPPKTIRPIRKSTFMAPLLSRRCPSRGCQPMEFQEPFLSVSLLRSSVFVARSLLTSPALLGGARILGSAGVFHRAGILCPCRWLLGPGLILLLHFTGIGGQGCQL